MLKGVHHVAYVVSDLDKTMEMLKRVFGLTPSRRQIVEKAGQEVVLYEMESGATLEVIRPLHEQTVWAEFIRRHGDGVHHIGYAVDAVNESLTELDARGVVVTDKQARVSGVGWTVGNIDASSTDGLSFQLVQL